MVMPWPIELILIIAVFVVLYLVPSVLVGFVATSYGRSPAVWFLVSILATPLMSFIALALVGRVVPEDGRDGAATGPLAGAWDSLENAYGVRSSNSRAMIPSNRRSYNGNGFGNERLRAAHSGAVLTESIGIETAGGAFSPVVEKGTRIPVTIKEVFTTGADNQTAVEIHVVAGTAGMAEDNRTIGRFQIYGIAPAARGVPLIEVEYTVDGEGVLTVKAQDLGTGKENEIRILDLPKGMEE